MTVRAFFGDATYEFAFSGPLISELERKVGVGIGQLCRDTLGGKFHFAHLIEIIRLGLIGGGASPKQAAELVDAYGSSTPISELFATAVVILEHLYFGDKAPDADA